MNRITNKDLTTRLNNIKSNSSQSIGSTPKDKPGVTDSLESGILPASSSQIAYSHSFVEPECTHPIVSYLGLQYGLNRSFRLFDCAFCHSSVCGGYKPLFAKDGILYFYGGVR